MKYRWWIIQVLMVLASAFFLVFGLDLLTASYGLDNPFDFIMTFFSACFIILISLALVASFLIKIIRVYRQIKNHSAKN